MQLKISYIVDDPTKLPENAVEGELSYIVSAKKVVSYEAQHNRWKTMPSLITKPGDSVVDMTKMGALKLHTLAPAAMNFYPISIVPRLLKRTGLLASALISVGTDRPGYSNIQSSKKTIPPALTGGTEIWVNVLQPARVEPGGVYEVQLDIVGYYK